MTNSRSSDSVIVRRRRALYRASRRGTKELDMLVGGFVRAHIEAMDEGALEDLERFLWIPDPVLQEALLAGRAAAPWAEDEMLARWLLWVR